MGRFASVVVPVIAFGFLAHCCEPAHWLARVPCRHDIKGRHACALAFRKVRDHVARLLPVAADSVMTDKLNYIGHSMLRHLAEEVADADLLGARIDDLCLPICNRL